jgi:hypothetical protein
VRPSGCARGPSAASAQDAATVETEFKLAWRDADVSLDVKEL